MDLTLPSRRNPTKQRLAFKRAAPVVTSPLKLLPVKKPRLLEDFSSAWLPADCKAAERTTSSTFELQVCERAFRELSNDLKYKLCALDPALFSSIDRECRRGWLAHRTHAQPLVVSQLLTTTRSSPRLQALDLSSLGRNVSEARLKIFSCDSSIAKLRLQSLNLSNVKNISPASLARLLTRVSWRKDSRLNLFGVPASSDVHITAILTRLVDQGVLAHLQLGGIADFSIERQCSAASKAALKSFTLTQTTADGPLSLLAASASTLEEVNLNSCEMRNEDFLSDRDFPLLRSLSLQNTLNVALSTLSLLSAPALETLDLGGVALAEPGQVDEWLWAVFLRSSIARFPELRCLNLAKSHLQLSTFLTIIGLYESLEVFQIELCISEDLAGDVGPAIVELSLPVNRKLEVFCRGTSIFADATNLSLLYHGYTQIHFTTTERIKMRPKQPIRDHPFYSL